MFRFENITVKVTSVTNVAELAGKTRVPAITFGVRITGPSTLLNQFDAELRTFLFKKAAPKPGELALDDEGLYEQRFPAMGSIPWHKEYAGYQVLLPIGATGTEDVLLNDVGCKGFIFGTLEGGSVNIDFKCHAKPASESDHGKIARLLQTECKASFLEPEVDPTLFDGQDKDDEGYGEDDSPATPAPDTHTEQRAALDKIFGATGDDNQDDERDE